MDGVLNSDAFFTEIGKTFVPGWDHIDPKAVARLNKIIAATGAVVVISSTWRRAFSMPVMQEMLDKAGFVGKIIGHTPMKLGYVRRGYEIKWWFDERAEDGLPPPEAFVCLDDDREMEPFEAQTVQTMWDEGLLDSHVEPAVAILNAKDNK